jgi:hypothetical protein
LTFWRRARRDNIDLCASFTSRDEAAAARNRASYAILRKSVAKLSAGLQDHPFGFAEQKELQLMAEA